jgi:hypothetical protein
VQVAAESSTEIVSQTWSWLMNGSEDCALVVHVSRMNDTAFSFSNASGLRKRQDRKKSVTFSDIADDDVA